MVDSAPALDTVHHRPDELPRATAHRGGMALGTENTLATFGRSVALGVRNLETDVRVTRDGHVVCVHDRTLARITDPSSRLVRRLRNVAWRS